MLTGASSPQTNAISAILDQKSWDSVKATEKDRKIAEQNAEVNNSKAIRY